MLGQAVRWLALRLPEAWLRIWVGVLGDCLSDRQLSDTLRRLITARVESLPPEEALRLLFRLDASLYALQGRQAVRYGQGVHVKHRLTGYHDFFVARLSPGERVLDVGCGHGALTRDMAERGGCRVVGIELEADKVVVARREHAHPRVEYRIGDATAGQGEDPERFDVVTLSNVLEHLPDRAAFLRRLVRQVAPARLLIRVPLFDREWRVPLKQELGVEWRLDATHETEYTLEGFMAEMNEAGLLIRHLEMRWGEIWAETVPAPPVGSVES
ncbi:MAG: class I SAM-dependent methyltransferase [Magnetococcales bacterium]|nr:class I SAM-dependent methyltransferase [Magnetococcales bacterium]